MRVPRINMKIIELNLSHDNFYCPVTGCHIQGNQHFEPSPAMTGGWHSDIIDEPLIVTGLLKTKWEEYIEKIETKDECIDIIDFLNSVNSDSLVCFEISTSGVSCGPFATTVWFVIDFNFSEPVL